MSGKASPSPTLILLAGLITREILRSTFFPARDWLIVDEKDAESLADELLRPLNQKEYPTSISWLCSEYLTDVQWRDQADIAGGRASKNIYYTFYIAMFVLGLKRPTADGTDAGIAYPSVFAVLYRALVQLGPVYTAACAQELESWYGGCDPDLLAMSAVTTACASVQWAADAVRTAPPLIIPEDIRELAKSVGGECLWSQLLNDAAGDAQELHKLLVQMMKTAGD